MQPSSGCGSVPVHLIMESDQCRAYFFIPLLPAVHNFMSGTDLPYSLSVWQRRGTWLCTCSWQPLLTVPYCAFIRFFLCWISILLSAQHLQVFFPFLFISLLALLLCEWGDNKGLCL
ncbi:unnamed protein product [Phytomonas sp. Hart1]|nr:unnamed protein product [Phytomonas sp. Hart1]|eukprot:CCW67393.1 unnamed protein product [Phytomonas sp. isolate Hart1]